MTMVRRVWRNNVDEEMARMEECLVNFPMIALDTEFPGTIYRTRFDSSDAECYTTMKRNVENTKLIQFGFTLFNKKGDIGGVWECNFCNFGDPTDARNEDSISFLKLHGLDLDKIRKEGVDMYEYEFFRKVMTAFLSQEQFEFVTFHGAYDIAYILCILMNGKLPETHQGFAYIVSQIFGLVYDTKVMAGYCEGLGDHLGLSKLAQLLQIPDLDRAHNAGSDSLTTARVFIKLTQNYEESKFARGIIYGVGKGTVLKDFEPETGSKPLYLDEPEPLYLDEPGPLYLELEAMFSNQDVSNCEEPVVYFKDASGLLWKKDKDIFMPLLPETVYAYPYQTPYAVY